MRFRKGQQIHICVVGSNEIVAVMKAPFDGCQKEMIRYFIMELDNPQYINQNLYVF